SRALYLTPNRSRDYFVSFTLTFVPISVTYSKSDLARYGRGLGGSPGSRGRVRCPRAGLQPALGRLWASSLRHYDRSARCCRWTGTGRGGERPLSKGYAKTVPPPPRKPGPRPSPLPWKTPLGHDP